MVTLGHGLIRVCWRYPRSDPVHRISDRVGCALAAQLRPGKPAWRPPQHRAPLGTTKRYWVAETLPALAAATPPTPSFRIPTTNYQLLSSTSQLLNPNDQLQNSNFQLRTPNSQLPCGESAPQLLRACRDRGGELTSVRCSVRATTVDSPQTKTRSTPLRYDCAPTLLCFCFARDGDNLPRTSGRRTHWR